METYADVYWAELHDAYCSYFYDAIACGESEADAEKYAQSKIDAMWTARQKKAELGGEK